ncbi:MAG TPA: formate/nitrite transporter family protein [Ruminiclostridium sp.]
MEKLFRSPEEISERFVELGCEKTNYHIVKLFVLSILAGAFIGFAAEGSNAAIYSIASVGLGKALAGALFATGLMLVIIAGGELFTGNCLIIISCSERKNGFLKMLRNWLIVYSGNFIGSMIIVLLIFLSGQLDFSKGMLGAFTIKIAVYKVHLSFVNAFTMGILCNWLVCLAVWVASAAKDITGKLIAIFFPIWLFITSGFEHSIANMYYIPIGILAKSNKLWVEAAATMGVTSEKLADLNWGSFVLKNLIPVTLGNIVGGSLFVGFAYWLAYLYKKK